MGDFSIFINGVKIKGYADGTHAHVSHEIKCPIAGWRTRTAFIRLDVDSPSNQILKSLLEQGTRMTMKMVNTTGTVLFDCPCRFHPTNSYDMTVSREFDVQVIVYKWNFNLYEKG